MKPIRITANSRAMSTVELVSTPVTTYCPSAGSGPRDRIHGCTEAHQSCGGSWRRSWTPSWGRWEPSTRRWCESYVRGVLSTDSEKRRGDAARLKAIETRRGKITREGLAAVFSIRVLGRGRAVFGRVAAWIATVRRAMTCDLDDTGSQARQIRGRGQPVHRHARQWAS